MSPTERAAASAEFAVARAAASCCKTGQDAFDTTEVTFAEAVEATELGLIGVESILAAELSNNLSNWLTAEQTIFAMKNYRDAATAANDAAKLVIAEAAISEDLFVSVQAELADTVERAFATLGTVEASIPGPGLPPLAELQAANSLIVAEDIAVAEYAFFTEQACAES